MQGALSLAPSLARNSETLEKQREKPRGFVLGFSVKSYPRKFRGFERLPVQTLISDLLKDCRFANALESKAYGFQDRFGGAF